MGGWAKILFGFFRGKVGISKRKIGDEFGHILGAFEIVDYGSKVSNGEEG